MYHDKCCALFIYKATQGVQSHKQNENSTKCIVCMLVQKNMNTNCDEKQGI
jgi:hypothetical protein